MDNNFLQNINIGKILEKYNSFENGTKELFTVSGTYNAICGVRDAFKKYLKESFLMKITEQKEAGPLSISDSKIAGRSISTLKAFKAGAVDYFKNSETGAFIHQTRTDLCANPLKTISVIGVTALITNAALLMIVKADVDLFGWITRIAFVLSGIAVILSDAPWKDVKDSSVLVGFFAGNKSVK